MFHITSVDYTKSRSRQFYIVSVVILNVQTVDFCDKVFAAKDAALQSAAAQANRGSEKKKG